MMDAKRVASGIGRAAAQVAAVVCMTMSVGFLRTAEKLHRLAADIATRVGPAWSTVGPTDETTRTAPVWAGLALVLAAVSGALLCFSFLPRPAGGTAAVEKANGEAKMIHA